MPKQDIEGGDSDSIVRSVGLADAVKLTSGAKGRNRVLDENGGLRLIAKNSVTVAEVIEFQQPLENMGAVEIGSKASDMAAEGKITAKVLAQTAYREPSKNVTTGTNPAELKRGIEKAVAAVTEELKALGKDSAIAAQPAVTSLEVVEGMGVDRAWPRDGRRLQNEARKLGGCKTLIGTCPAMQEVYELIGFVARSDASIFITGETGTGKEVVAKTLHALSRRPKEAFLTVNCGAVSANLIESELFGHERGSFTGADRRHRGFFERANRGTLFLDEIGEMPRELQVKLLRVLESSEVTRVGGTESIKFDVRIITATNRPLKELVAAGKLRKDLYYRLNVFPIALPPLRERGRDVDLLAEHFLDEFNSAEGTAKQLTPTSRERLRRHGWPGNLRELKNVIQRAFILAGETLEVDAWPESIEETDSMDVVVPAGTPIAVAERQLILATLGQFGGDKRKVASALKISLKTLYARLSEYRARAC